MDVVKSYAKVNLGLRVVRKTRKNYHKLEMIMSQIELYDEIYFEESDEVIVEMDKDICEMKQNLCYKIACYLKEKYKVSQGVHIYIKKNIPDGGGLGGGSSNAAVVLKYLNKKWDLKLNENKLKKIGFQFGCDIPFFIKGNISLVKGFGEKIKELKVPNNTDEIVLVIPNFKCETKEVFEKHKIDEINKQSIKKIITGLKKRNYKKLIFNDLEKTVDHLTEGAITNIIKRLEEISIYNVKMSGSGSTIVCYLDETISKDDIFSQIKNKLSDCQIIFSKLKMYSY